MSQISVGYTDDGVVVLMIVDPDHGLNVKAPLLPQEAFTLGENLIEASRKVRGLTRPAIIVPHPALPKGKP